MTPYLYRFVPQAEAALTQEMLEREVARRCGTVQHVHVRLYTCSTAQHLAPRLGDVAGPAAGGPATL